MRRPEWLFVVALLLVGAYFSYRYFSKQEKFDPFQLVPKTAVAVYETKDILQIYSRFNKFDFWEDLKDIDDITTASTTLSTLDSFSTNNRRVNKRLIAERTLVSLHVTGSESSGLVFYLPTGAGSKNLLKQILEKHTSTPSNYLTRVYEGLTIHELSSAGVRLSFINHNNYVIVSTVGYLVEDVVRNLNNEFIDNFLTANKRLVKVPKLTDDGGNLYFNGSQLSDFYNSLMPALSQQVGSLAQSIFFDIKLSEDDIFMSGFLFEEEQSEFAAIFQDQEAGFSPSLRLVPSNAAIVTSINVSDVSSWYQRWMNTYSKKKEPYFGVENQFINAITGEITLATFSSNDKSRKDKLMMIKLSDKEAILNILNKQAEDIALANNDTVYFENFSDYKIGLIEKDEYVADLFGEPYSGFSSTFFMLHQDYLLFSSSSERLKRWLSDMEDNSVWGRSAEQNSFIDDRLAETSFAVIFTNPWGWNFAQNKFNVKQNEWWLKNESVLKQFGVVSYQFSNLDNRYYNELNLIYNPVKVEAGQQALSDLSLSLVNNKLVRKPKLVKNHNNNQWEILLQDSAYNISLLDDKGEFLWQDSLRVPIIGKIYQIDHFKNRKLQYLFATDSALHIVDRNGKSVDGYPVAFSDFQISNLFLIDYDHSRNYRFLLSDNSGNLRMLNEKGKLLEGWNPLRFNSTLTDQVYHVRVRGKDRIIAGLENGIIEMRNRKAVRQRGFPIDLQFNLVNPLHFSIGSTFEDSRFTAISTEGMIAEFDLNGKLYARTQLDQITGSSRFQLVNDPAQNDYIIARQDLNRLAILSKNGDVFFEKDYQSNSIKDVQYYSLGVDKQLLIVRDTELGKVYFYNKNGTLINSDEVYSDYPVSVVYRKSQSKCYIYTAKNQSIEVSYFSF